MADGIDAMDTDSAAVAARNAASRSCTTCSKAKAKCVRAAGHVICERCARLRKECQMKEPVLRRRKTVKTTRAAQLEKLENKIEHLVNALSTQQALVGQPSPPIAQSEAASATRQAEVLNSLCPQPSNSSTGPVNDVNEDCCADPPPVHLSQPNDASLVDESDPHALGVTMGEAEILLDRWRRLMAPGLPFVVIQSDVTAQQMYASKPFLLHAIVTVTYFHDLPKQQRMVKHMMRDISERVLMNNEKNLGILQGILVFVAWYHPHVFWGQQVTNLLHLAMALAIDTGIDRAPGTQTDFKSAATKAVHGPGLSTRIPTMDERRVLAGVFYLTSMLSSSFKKIEASSYTKYLEDCLNILEQAKEYDSDLLLVQIVRLQSLAEDTHTTETPTAPMQMYVKAFNADLNKLKQNDPCKESNIFLNMQYLTAEILVWELSLNDLQETKSKPLRSHLDDMYRCMEAIDCFIAVYFTIPTSAYLTIPFSVFGQFAHAFIVLTKLASLEVDGWDVRNCTVDFTKIIEEAAERFDGACQSSPDGLRVNNDAFAKWAHRVRWMKQVYEAKFLQEGFAQQDKQQQVTSLFNRQDFSEPATVAMTGAQQPTPPDDVLSGDFFNYLDEGFWQSFPGEFDLGFPEVNMSNGI